MRNRGSNILPCAMLSLLSLGRANILENVKYVYVQNVKVDEIKHTCEYRNYTFNSTLVLTDPCMSLECYWRKQEVVISECKQPKRNCVQRPSEGKVFPECCQTTCFEETYRCLTPDGVLLEDGQSFSCTSPCVKYTCRKGTLETERCRTSNDPFCAVSQADSSRPYPDCCGSIVCSRRRR
uniref:Single domain-containing protein n=1 Tax=Amblyomma maculatum TaxID=34609 RepID=G3MT60_AMBMU